MKRIGQVYREGLVNRISDGLSKNPSIFLLSFSRMNGPKLNDLRKTLKKAGAEVLVSRNAIANIALKEFKQEGLGEKISGQTAFVWSTGDSAELSKILIKFTKDSENIVVQGGLLDGSVLNQSDVKKLSDLPSKNVLLSQLLSIIQAPATRIAGALNAKSRDLLSILKQLSEKKGGN